MALKKLSPPQRGFNLMELIVSISILTMVLSGFAALGMNGVRLFRQYYCRAAAMQIVDGEMEVLAAGEWRAYGPGVHEFHPPAQSAANLPPGRFVLTIGDGRCRLEWRPDSTNAGGPVTREAAIQ